MDPAISVVIPAYNREKWIGRAIASALAQNYPAAEIIVVDDGSTDGTAAACEEFAGRIRFIKQANGGASAARNHGVLVASNPWIAFLDSDDYWQPFHLEAMAQAIRDTGGSARFYFCDMALPAEEGGGTLWERIGFRIPGKHLLLEDATPWMLMKRQPTMLQSSVFSRRSLLDAGGMLPELKLMHDSDLYNRIGIGSPACAVAGAGCIQTAADDAGNRLTGVFTVQTAQHAREQLRMWRNAAALTGSMNARHARLVRYNLAAAHWTIARNALRNGSPAKTAYHLLRLAISDPRLLLWILTHRSARGYEERVRPPDTSCSGAPA